MKTLDEVMSALEALGSETTKRTLVRHGAVEPFFGVKVGDLKPLQKQLKGQQELALELFATKIGDAQYLAGLVADGARMSRKELDRWASTASWWMISAYSVAWVACEHPEAVAIATKWTASKTEPVAVAGWSTLGAVASVWPDERLPIKEFRDLLKRCAQSIHSEKNRVKSAMNGFVIAVGTYVAPLADEAFATAKSIGGVEVDVGETACKVPLAVDAITKARRGLPVAPKRKAARC